MRLVYLTILFFCTYYLQGQTYAFTIEHTESKKVLKSCLDVKWYIKELYIPQENKSYTRSTHSNKGVQIYDSRWKDDCLYINVIEYTEREIIDLILEFTILKEEQITLSFN